MSRLSKLERLRVEQRERDGRREAMRNELADSAIQTLAQLGYARTSLRDIAEQSGRSTGLIHYYFTDKVELIQLCVRRYKQGFVEGIDRATAAASTPAGVRAALVEALAHAVENDAHVHRLWYDIRAQALFDTRFFEAVSDIEQDLVDMLGRALVKMRVPRARALGAYLALDNHFRYALLRHLGGAQEMVEELRVSAHAVLEGLKPGT